MRPFSCGSQYGDWTSANCERCTKAAEGYAWPTCEIEAALCEAYCGDGEITDRIAARMGESKGRYNWPCGEVEWTEEWKAKCEQV